MILCVCVCVCVCAFVCVCARVCHVNLSGRVYVNAYATNKCEFFLSYKRSGLGQTSVDRGVV